MFLNPTLSLSSGVGTEQRPEAIYLRQRGGPVRCPVSLALAEALSRVRRGARPGDIFSDDVLAWLAQREILLAHLPEPPPAFRPALPSAALPFVSALARPSEVTCCRRISWSSTPSGHVLRRMADWGGVEEELWLSDAQQQRWLRWLSASPPADWTSDDESLLAAGALVAGSEQPASRQTTSDIASWQARYRAQRHVIVDGLVSTTEHHALTAYTSQLLARGFLDGDYGTYGRQRSCVYDDAELRPLHQRLAPLVSAIAERPLVPSYSFLAFYHGGGALPRHRDKVHCQASISLSISCPPEVAEHWPLCVYAGQMETKLYWRAGQALFFEGRSLEHCRPPLPGEQQATYLVLHFQGDPELS